MSARTATVWIWPWRDRGWYAGQRKLIYQQPVAHALGGFAWGLFARLLWWPAGDWRIVLFTGGMALWWQLFVWESEPDGSYPTRWLVWDVLVEMIIAFAVTQV